MFPSAHEVEVLVDRALQEDVFGTDATTSALIPPDLKARGAIISKEPGIIAGLDIAAKTFERVDPQLQVVFKISDGASVHDGEILSYVSGSMSSILIAERTALNVLQRMSGIATITSEYVKLVEGFKAEIADTRKTAPGLRIFDKYAVSVGGGRNHRMNLSDGVLIKDNHLAALKNEGIDLGQSIRLARSRAPHTLKIEVEVDSIGSALIAAESGADIVMLDNMSPKDMAIAVEGISGKSLIEASGGITFENVISVARSGVDIISVGALTHSPRALDISLDYEPIFDR